MICLIAFFILKPEIDERVKTWRINSTETYDKENDCKYTHEYDGAVSLFFGEKPGLPPFNKFKASPEGEEHSKNENGVEFWVEVDHETAAFIDKHLFEIFYGCRQWFSPEKYPADQYNEVGNDDAGNLTYHLIDFQQEDPVSVQPLDELQKFINTPSADR